MKLPEPYKTVKLRYKDLWYQDIEISAYHDGSVWRSLLEVVIHDRTIVSWSPLS